MKQIYIILTHTGTMLSKIIKCYTRYEYSHVSVSLDPELQEMYSFGRLHPYNPFITGFVHEYIDKGTFKRFKKTRTRVIELEISDEQYLKLKELIEKMQIKKEQYKFNLLGLFAVGFNIRRKKKNHFYCAEFVKYAMEEADINIQLPELIKPESFKRICTGRDIYKGFLRDYHYIRNRQLNGIG